MIKAIKIGILAILAFALAYCFSAKQIQEQSTEDYLAVDSFVNSEYFEILVIYRTKELTNISMSLDNSIIEILMSIKRKTTMFDSLRKILSDSLVNKNNDENANKEMKEKFYRLQFLFKTIIYQRLILSNYLERKKIITEKLTEITLMKYSEENYRKLLEYNTED